MACALPPSSPDPGTRIRALLTPPVDLNQLSVLASYHRLLPLLYKASVEYGIRLVPEPEFAELATAFRAHAARSLHLTSELITLSRAFASAQIPVLPHKGPLLAQAAYGDLAMREFTDLDLLIHAADLPQAIALLAEHGYHAPDELAWLSPSALLRWSPEMTYRSARGVAVDLHWRLAPSHYTVQLDPEILWRSRTTMNIGGAEIPTLGPEALLLLLSVHGAKHAWECLGWLADIAWLLHANPKLTWTGAMALAPNVGCRRAVALAEALIKVVFDGEKSSDALCRRVLERWYNGPLEPPESPELFAFARALSAGPGDSFKHLLGSILDPTEGDWRTRQLPESLFRLYAPLRAVRLAGKYLLRRPAANTIQ